MKVTTDNVIYVVRNFHITYCKERFIAAAVSERGRVKPVESYYMENMKLTGISREVG